MKQPLLQLPDEKVLATISAVVQVSPSVVSSEPARLDQQRYLLLDCLCLTLNLIY